ncbi:MAG: hydroxyacylglutathione hydrolase [Candidatus Sericytochromatia bacterium]|nr:hydroxyacylglutathione hydrolase [Candidatus Sericytochromatia bacterium]
MKILPISCLKDNYAYLLICEDSQQVGVVDPSEAEPILAVLAAHHLPLHVVLNTHHHWDHTGGNEGLKARFPALQIWGHASDRGRIAGQTHFLEDGQHVQLGQLQGRVIHNPGHTRGAVSYHFQDALFTGDTLFGAGCGRTFEGTAAQMQASLQRLAALPATTRCFFGHEYTRSNLHFAQAVEPGNPAITARSAQLQGTSTPSTLAEELRSNPFLRCDQPAVIAAASAREPGLDPSDPAEVFRVLRAWKDGF